MFTAWPDSRWLIILCNVDHVVSGKLTPLDRMNLFFSVSQTDAAMCLHCYKVQNSFLLPSTQAFSISQNKVTVFDSCAQNLIAGILFAQFTFFF